MAMQRSRIEIVDRLRRLDIWDDASWHKDQIKQRLMSEGLSRREANHRAWEEMEELFDGDNLERYFVFQIILMGAFPPLIDDAIANQPGEPIFEVTWELWCLALARLDCWENEDFEAAEAIAVKVTQVEAAQEGRTLVETALYEVNRFARDFAAPKFRAVIERLKASGESEAQEYAHELSVHLAEMSRFGVRKSK